MTVLDFLESYFHDSNDSLDICIKLLRKRALNSIEESSPSSHSFQLAHERCKIPTNCNNLYQDNVKTDTEIRVLEWFVVPS